MQILHRPAVPSWFEALVGVSAALVLITFFSYALNDQSGFARALFWLGLGGENNVGAWWSGMLLVLGAVLAFDGFADSTHSRRERSGWCFLGFSLLLLSFDEVASLHEFLSDRGLAYLAVLGAVGLALVGYALTQLYRAGVATRRLALLMAPFGLLATVPVHEAVQQAFAWPDPIVYGIRAALEEGTEIAAMLLFIWVLRANSVSLLRVAHDVLATPAHRRRLVRASAIVLWLVFTAATFVLPRPSGPADWLASVLFLLCALLALRALLRRGGNARSKVLILFYVVASAAATAVPVEWNPVVLSAHVSIRGVGLSLLVVTSALLLPANGRRMNLPRALLVAAVIAASAVMWSESQLLWCGLPPLLALWLYSIESRAETVGSVPAATLAPTVA